MSEMDDSDGGYPWGLQVLAAADLQDQVLTAKSDLERLENLLGDACQTLMASFHEATARIAEIPTEDVGARDAALHSLSGAVTALQFQDMASQLILHACRRLGYCVDRLAVDAFGPDDEGSSIVMEPPGRPSPVAQAEMVDGSIELF